MDESRRDAFEDWEVAIARKLCAEFSARYPWAKGMEVDDLIQQCLLHWYVVRGGYSSDKGASRQTYMGKVLRHLLVDLIAHQMTDRRKAHHLAVSLEQSVGEEAEGGLDVIADEADLSLRPDLEKTLTALSPLQRRICRLLALGYTAVEVSGRLNKHRSAIYRELGQIKRVFQEHGLRDHLE